MRKTCRRLRATRSATGIRESLFNHAHMLRAYYPDQYEQPNPPSACGWGTSKAVHLANRRRSRRDHRHVRVDELVRIRPLAGVGRSDETEHPLPLQVAVRCDRLRGVFRNTGAGESPPSWLRSADPLGRSPDHGIASAWMADMHQEPTQRRPKVGFSHPGPRRIFLGCAFLVAGSLLWSARFVRVLDGVLIGVGWALAAWGLFLTWRASRT
jgi:hypothetical protein